MDACELPARDAEDVARLVRALGSHRYVAGRLHMVHAFVFDCAASSDDVELAEAAAWARATLADKAIDAGSRDERLWRASSEAEVARALVVFWSPDEKARVAREKLLARLVSADIEPPTIAPGSAVFDEMVEEDIFPVLIDAGWELHALAQLEPERHKGAIAAFGEPILFEAARFEEESALERPRYLQELPVMGPAELLEGVDEHGFLREPLTLWTEGAAAYHDYVIRGVLRAAKLT